MDNGAIYMLDIQEFIGKSNTEADRKRSYRARIKEEKENELMVGQITGQMSPKCPDKRPPEKEIEKEIEKENYMVQNSDEIQNDSFDFKILIGQIKICYAMLLDESSSLPYDSMDYIEIFEYFYKCYEEYTGNTHPKIKSEYVKKVMSDLPYVVGDNVDDDVDVETNKLLIDTYFKQPWNDSINPTILHFMSENIRLHRYYEVR
jgi:hypothetical protein